MSIPQELRDLNQWVCAKNGSKCPFKSWTPEPASSSDPATWSDFETADYSVMCGHYDQVGFVFYDNGYVGIDIDCGWDEDGLLSPTAVDILLACGSYTEHSRSGRGFHVIVKGFLPFSGKNNQHGVEIYQKGRYFIMTGKTAVYDQIIPNQTAIDYVVSKYFQEEERDKPSGDIDLPFPRSRVYNPRWELPENGRVKLRPVYPRIPKGSRNLS